MEHFNPPRIFRFRSGQVSFTTFLTVVFALVILDRMALFWFRPLGLGAWLLADTLRQSTDAHLVNCLGQGGQGGQYCDWIHFISSSLEFQAKR